MKILFLHKNFPAQFRHLAAYLGHEGGHEIVFGSLKTEGAIPGVRRVFFEARETDHRDPHPYVVNLQNAVTVGQGVHEIGQTLKSEGFEPDLVYAHAGWGPGLFVKDVWPRARLMSYFEWFYRAGGPDVEEPEAEGDERKEREEGEDGRRLRVRNAAMLVEYANSDWAVSPTRFQAGQFPHFMRSRMTVHHDGIDTRFFRPAQARPNLRDIGIEVPADAPIVTYATRGMEPYRGFPQAMRAMKAVLQERNDVHAVVLGQDRVAYGRQLPKGESWKARMLAELDLEPFIEAGRLHFPGLMPYTKYLQVLQASTAHIYLTVPFVLSWSLLESMSAGCLVVSSRTEPVEEVITHGHNGLLVDLQDWQALSRTLLDALARPRDLYELRRAARATVVGRYALADLLPRHLALMRLVAEGGEPGRDSRFAAA
ncbi:MAG: glycosyltransferase [Alphaproteobacteria bacterium]|nr:glycosyltransferase [Alphaproteobacteria bacterium]